MSFLDDKNYGFDYTKVLPKTFIRVLKVDSFLQLDYRL